MSTRLNQVIKNKIRSGQKLLSIFITAGFPEKDSSEDIIIDLADSGVDFIELGIPFSDPIADGPVIQQASDRAIANGMFLPAIFETITRIRRQCDIPIILMGYLNPLLKMGLETFIDRAGQCDVDGLIIPDWPFEENKQYAGQLQKHDIDLIHLVAPNTPAERIQTISALSSSFIYCVAYTGVTGRGNSPSDHTIKFLNDLRTITAKPLIVGFGVKNRDDFITYSKYADGVIIGSAFIRLLEDSSKHEQSKRIRSFIKTIKP